MHDSKYQHHMAAKIMNTIFVFVIFDGSKLTQSVSEHAHNQGILCVARLSAVTVTTSRAMNGLSSHYTDKKNPGASNGHVTAHPGETPTTKGALHQDHLEGTTCPVKAVNTVLLATISHDADQAGGRWTTCPERQPVQPAMLRQEARFWPRRQRERTKQPSRQDFTWWF